MISTVVVAGPAEHGVVIFASELADALGPAAERVIAADSTQLDPAKTGHPGSVVLLQFTDQLWGPRCDISAARLAEFARTLNENSGAAVAVTLHDVPDPGDDPARYARRSAAYRVVIDAVCGRVIVNSQNEADRARAISPECRPTVIPLPIAAPAHLIVPTTTDGHVTMLGFLHPGKGHADVLDAMADLPRDVALVALGRYAAGHDDLDAQLRHLAATRQRHLDVTGFIPAAELKTRLQRAGVPVAAHADISASGSIGAWLSAGRRPLVPDCAYSRELEQRCPGALTLYRADTASLAAALAHAVADPASTWLADDVPIGPSASEAAARYCEVLTRWAPAGARV